MYYVTEMDGDSGQSLAGCVDFAGIFGGAGCEVVGRSESCPIASSSTFVGRLARTASTSSRRASTIALRPLLSRRVW